MTTAQRKFIRCPFRIFVDTAEQTDHAWRFEGITADADRLNATFLVRTDRTCLGRHPNSLGDYTLEGGINRCHIERKSKEDAWGTILGWPTGWETDRDLPGRRDRFECELENLNRLECACVIVEATLGTCCVDMLQWGVKSPELNAKIFARSVLSYQQRFPRVQWMFADSPWMAEQWAFRWFYRFWEKNLKPKKEEVILI